MDGSGLPADASHHLHVAMVIEALEHIQHVSQRTAFEPQLHAGSFPFCAFSLSADDVSAQVVQKFEQIREEPGSIVREHFDVHTVKVTSRRSPFDIDDPFRLFAVDDLSAVATVNHQAATSRDESDHVVAR